MELDALLDAIGRDAEAEIERIVTAADAEVESIHQGATIDAERVGREAGRSRDGQLRSEVDRRRAIAELGLAKIERAAIEDGRRAIEVELVRLLASQRARFDYRSLLDELLEEAASVASPSVVHVDPRDATLVAEIAATRHLDIEVRPDLASMGGLTVETSDGRLVINTVEERLRNADPALREALARHVERIVDGAAESPAHRPDDGFIASPVSPLTAGAESRPRTKDRSS